ncbi:unnamed protein product [Linum trigynum]|uniref:Replication factor A C-terminal domain-containing protein n=1 Tax=Linum trigynum TaxID=586398 RepID=A0AAV2GWC8_9ROSI
MNYSVLSKLTWTASAPALKLRLLHTWIAGNPKRQDGFSEFATLWTDELGVLVQGLAARTLSSHLSDILIVGEVYFIKQFGQRESRKRWAACSNDRTLHFTSSTSFLLSDQEESTFCADSFEFRQFEDLPPMAREPTFCVDVVGRLVSVTPVTYFQRQEHSVKKQTIVIENERKFSLSITLWADFADKLPLADLILIDNAAPVIAAFTSLNLSLWRGTVGASNTSATRIVVSPTTQESQALAAFFVDAVAPIGVVPAECDTPEKALTVYRESFKTIPDLQEIRSDSTMGGKFRCKGKVTDIDTSHEWCYLGCAVCSRTAVRRDAPFWCEKCQATIHPHQLKQCFRIRLMVHDGCAFAPFVLLGQTAESFLEVSASVLLAAAPDRGGGYPPEIEALMGQECIFLVNLPLGQASDPMDDFCALAVEKDDNLQTVDARGHGPRFGKKAHSVVTTVHRFPLLPSVAVANLITASNIPTTPMKQLKTAASTTSSPNSVGLNSPLAAINILSNVSRGKDKVVETDASHPNVVTKLACAPTHPNSSCKDTTDVHDSLVSIPGLKKDIPPAMLPINPVTHPLAKVKLEKLGSSLRNKKQQPADCDDMPISQLKKKTTKPKSAAKKLFG